MKDRNKPSTRHQVPGGSPYLMMLFYQGPSELRDPDLNGFDDLGSEEKP